MPIALDVDGYVHRLGAAAGRDEANQLLQGDEVLAVAADEEPEILALDLELWLGTVVDQNLGFDAHQRQDLAQRVGSADELLGIGRRRVALLDRILAGGGR